LGGRLRSRAVANWLQRVRVVASRVKRLSLTQEESRVRRVGEEVVTLKRNGRENTKSTLGERVRAKVAARRRGGAGT